MRRARVVETEPVEGYYRSPADRASSCRQAERRQGGRAQAGLNHCRYRYVCAVDADMVFARERSRARCARSCATRSVVGLTSYFENSARPGSVATGRWPLLGPDTRPLFAFQSFDYLRAFFNTRIGWARLNFMLCAAGAFQIWRRDLVEDLAGGRATFTCEDIEFTFRVAPGHAPAGASRTASRASRTAWASPRGPDSMRKLVSQRERWQRVILETWWANKRMCSTRGTARSGRSGCPSTSSPRSSRRSSRSWRS